MNQFERMQSIIDDYSEEFEDNKENKWVKEYNERLSERRSASVSLDDAMHEAIYAAQRLGFVEGMQFAFDVMSDDNSKNTKLLREFLESIQKEEGETENA